MAFRKPPGVSTVVTIDGPVGIDGPVSVDGSTVAVAGTVPVAGVVAVSGGVNVDGSTVDLAGGATVGLDGPVSVDNFPPTAPPDLSALWRCYGSDADPPTLAGTTPPGYAGTFGQTTLALLGGGTSYASYPTLNRYSPLGVDLATIVTFQLKLGGVAGAMNNSVGVGWSTAVNGKVDSGARYYRDGTHHWIELWAGGAGAAMEVTDLANTWIDVELVFAKTLTRLTVNRNPVRRMVGLAVPDSQIVSQFTVGTPTTPATNQVVNVSNLFVTYSSEIPA